MKHILIVGMTAPLLAMADDSTRPTDSLQVDYCSYVHSQFVLDRINAEIKPIFNTYDLNMVQDSEICTLNNFGTIENQLRLFGLKKKTKSSNHVCQMCGKEFDSEDYLEFHMK